MKRITSRQNAVVAQYRAVARGDETSLLLLDGTHLVNEALAAGVVVRHMIVAANAIDRDEIADLVQRAARHRIDVASASAPVMSAVSPVRSSSVVVAIAERPRYDSARLYADRVPLVMIATDVQDPGNVGAIVRVLEAAGGSGLIAAGRSADPFGWKALRGSMGSALRLPVVVDRNTTHALARARHHECRILATVPRGGRALVDADLTGRLAIVIGGEGPGLPASVLDAADERLTIPMQSPVESLNAAVTAALIVYEARRQRAR